MLTATKARRLLRYNKENGKLTRTATGRRAGGPKKNKYRYVKIGGVDYLEHRVIWLIVTGRWPAHTIDHKDRNKANNKWKNLRLATRRNQQGNAGHKSCSKTKSRGVFRRGSKYIAQLCIYVGCFNTVREAETAYRKAARKYFGKWFSP